MKTIWFLWIVIIAFGLLGCATDPMTAQLDGDEDTTVIVDNDQVVDVNTADDIDDFIKVTMAKKRALEVERYNKQLSHDVRAYNEYDTIYNNINDSRKIVRPGYTDTIDVWQRVRAGFQFAEYNNSRVNAELKYFLKNPDYIERVAERSRPYIHFILEEIASRGLPTELALLPVIESAYKTGAYSNKHASGLWQFIPSTGKLYGLRQNGWYDGRRDPYAATLAALDYLEYLNGYFDGDWLKALAAYNAGEGRVGRAARSNAARGKSTSFWSLSLPKETRHYVPRLIAVKMIIANPEKYGVNLPYIANQPHVVRLPVQHQVDLTKVARLAGMDWDTFYKLNAGFKTKLTEPNMINYILLPRDRLSQVNFTAAQASESDIRNVQSVVGTSSSKKNYIKTSQKKKGYKFLKYYVKKGDSLTRVARKYGTNATTLMQLNGLKTSTLYPGQKLVVPNPKVLGPYYVKTKSKGKKSSASVITHKVKKGETLWSIAQKYGVTVSSLKQWNKTGSTIKVGQKLVVKVSG